MQDYAAEEAEKKAPDSAASARDWLDKLKDYERAMSKWDKQIENLDKLYSKSDRADSADREYSIFWANLEVLKPAVYARPPVPVVAPRFKDGNPLAREASELLERCCVVQFEQGEVDGVMREVRDEYLRYGRGTAWARLAGEADDAVTIDWIPGCDFAHDPARSWLMVKWVARKAWMTTKEGVERFGEDFHRVPKKKENKPDDQGNESKSKDKVPVWEIWCKSSRMVYFVAEDCDHILDEREPWLDLQGFFPCPKPAYGTLVPGTLRPVPEIIQYKDQIEEINDYTARIAALSESLRLRGFYPSGGGDVSEALETAMKSMDDRAVLVPIASLAALGGGSLKDSIVWLPVVDALALVQGLVDLRRVLIEDVYQITGISDIVRGQTEASETAAAQTLKSQWGSLRIRERQQELARFARDITRMTAEIIAENFAPEVMKEMSQSSVPTMAEQQQAQQFLQQVQDMQAMAQQAQAAGVQLPPPPPPPKDAMNQAEKAVKMPTLEALTEFLRNDRARGFVIEIETDSTIAPDEDAEKQRRIEFVTAVGGMFQQAAPLVMQAPMLGPFAIELLRFAAGGFRAGRQLEYTLDQLGEAIEGMAEQASQPPPPPQPDPTEVLKLEGMKAKTEAEQMKAQGSMQKTQMDVQASAMKHGMTMERIQAETAAEMMTPGVNSIRGGE